jgi:hypothetical protein
MENSFILAPVVIVSVVVGSNGIEPSTLRLSGVRSNRLSYEPIFILFIEYQLLNNGNTL